MTKKTEDLAKKIKAQKQKQSQKTIAISSGGYQTAIDLLTNLCGCVLIGLSLGILFQNLFNTSALLTAGLTIFGGFAGLWSVVRYAIKR